MGKEKHAGHYQEYGKESKYQQASTFLENLKPRAATFSMPVPAGSSSPTPRQRTRISQISPTLACPYPRNPEEPALCSHIDHTQTSLCRRYLLSHLKEFLPSSFPDGKASLIIPAEDAFWLLLRC